MKTLALVLAILASNSAIAGGKIELETSSNIKEVQTVRVNYTDIRVVYLKMEVYPKLTVEIFTPGGEGAPTEVQASINLLPGKAPDTPSNVENINLTPIALTYEVLGKSCTYKIDLKAKGQFTGEATCQ
jgi:hypothetical protein